MKIVIVPHNTGRVREIKVHTFLVLGIVLVVVVSLIERYSRAKVVSDPSELARNNKYLEKKLVQYEYEYRDLVDNSDNLLALVNKNRSVNILGPENSNSVLSQVEYGKSIDELIENLEESKSTLDRVSYKLNQLPELGKFTPSVVPVDGYVIQTFGKVNYVFTGEERVCQGIDFSAPLGTKVCATAYGIVKFAGVRPHSGLTVEIEHTGAGLGRTFVTKYSHLSLLKVSKGQFVKRNEVIGFVGTTGNTIGPILHYEVWVDGEPQNPLDFILTEVTYF